MLRNLNHLADVKHTFCHTEDKIYENSKFTKFKLLKISIEVLLA